MFSAWFSLVTDLTAAQLSAQEIIARRMIGFAASHAKGTLATDPELTRMVTEKWSASIAGASAMSTAMVTAAANPANIMEAGAAVTRAAVTPALRQLKANNRRLRRRG